jgi:hypothetical protein
VLADLIPHILATRHETQRVNEPLPPEQRKAKYREHNKRRDEWRAKRRAQGLPVT